MWAVPCGGCEFSLPLPFPFLFLGYRRPLNVCPYVLSSPTASLSFPPSLLQQSKSKAHEDPNSGRAQPAQPSTTHSPNQTQANHPSPHSTAALTSQTTTSPPQARSSNTSTTANTSRAASPPPKTRPSNPTPLSPPLTSPAARSSSSPKSSP